MKIAIDCADLDHSRIDGTRVYIKNVLNWLGKVSPEDQFFLFHQREFNPMLAPNFLSNYFDRKTPYKLSWTQTRFAYELLQLKPDVCWMPIQQMPYLINKKIKTVVTIHDLAFKIFPENFPKKDRFKLNLFTDYAVKNADKIIAVSQSTKSDIIKFYPKINPDKIRVVYHGVNVNKLQITNNKHQINSKLKIKNSSAITPSNSPLHKGEKNADKERTESRVLGTPLQNINYILYLGAIQPRKDLITLVEGFEGLKFQENQPYPSPPLSKGRGPMGDLKLIIAGESAWQSEETLERIKKSKFSEDIILTGKVSFEEAEELYQKAAVFVFPSLYEGFGMPVLEAWSNNAPVVVANNSSLKEIGGEAVLKFETGNSQELAEKIEKILKDDKIKQNLINKGLERLKMFSWEKCAAETLEVLKSVN